MTPDQVKAARKLLGWSRVKLGALSDTSTTMVIVFEKTGRVVPLNSSSRTVPVDPVAAIRATLDEAGVEFTNGDAPGVRLRKPAGSE